MGLSYPRRITRAALGPKFRNNYPVENPETDIGETAFNAVFHTAAGLAVVAPRWSLVARWSSGWQIAHQAEAWNPDGTQPHPVLARAGQGNYTYTLAASYLDEDDIAVPSELIAARCTAMANGGTFGARVIGHAWIDTGNPLRVQIRLWAEADGSAVDAPFWLEGM